MRRSVSTINSLPSKPAWKNVRARPVRYGGFAIETELPCINGLSAWFTIAMVDAVDDGELLISDGAIGTAKQQADVIVSALNAILAVDTSQPTSETA